MRSYKKEIYITIIGAFIGIILLLGIIDKLIYDFSIKQEIKKAKLISDVVIDFRDYLSKVASCVHSDCKTHSIFACTPAYVVNKVSKTIRDKNHFLIRQVSDDYRNIHDKPNLIELNAINYFKKHLNYQEFYKIYTSNQENLDSLDKKYIFYARVLKIKPSCLKCHGDPKKDVPPQLYKVLIHQYGNKAFGYKVGEVKGIIAMYIPFKKVENFFFSIMLFLVTIFILVFIIGTLFFKRVTNNIYSDIEKILLHLKNKISKRKFLKINKRMNYLETQSLKDEVNVLVKELKRNQKELYGELYFHSTTDLFNRNKFFQLDRKYALIILNIDKFREINNYFGIEIGDKLIIAVANRLKKLKKERKFKIYHIDIDEFVLLFPLITNKNELINITKDIISILEKDYKIDNNEISIKFRAGISFEDKSYLCAEMALAVAKEENRDIKVCEDVKSYSKKYEEHLKWLTKIKKTLKENRIKPFYQPLVDKNREIIKYEALLRIIEKDGEVISPFFFLDIAKKTRYYLDITKIMLNEVIQKIETYNVKISINLSLEDIDNKEMRNFIINKIKSSLTNKSLLTIEIVETENIGNSKDVFDFLKEVKKLGIEIYIDDFGSGYANFDYLLKLNPDGIKIDGSLIENILENENNQKIVKTIISFAKESNIKTVAEFIGSKEIFEYLKDLGVDYFQGYYFSPPREDIQHN